MLQCIWANGDDLTATALEMMIDNFRPMSYFWYFLIDLSRIQVYVSPLFKMPQLPSFGMMWPAELPVAMVVIRDVWFLIWYWWCWPQWWCWIMLAIRYSEDDDKDEDEVQEDVEDEEDGDEDEYEIVWVWAWVWWYLDPRKEDVEIAWNCLQGSPRMGTNMLGIRYWHDSWSCWPGAFCVSFYIPQQGFLYRLEGLKPSQSILECLEGALPDSSSTGAVDVGCACWARWRPCLWICLSSDGVCDDKFGCDQNPGSILITSLHWFIHIYTHSTIMYYSYRFKMKEDHPTTLIIIFYDHSCFPRLGSSDHFKTEIQPQPPNRGNTSQLQSTPEGKPKSAGGLIGCDMC